MATVAVLGGGNGAVAAAAHLTLQGHRVRLFNRTPERLRTLVEHGGITIRGGVLPEAFVSIQVADSLRTAVFGADLVMLAMPALGHEHYAAALAPLVEPDQPIYLNPGATGGAFHVAAVLSRHGCTQLPPIAESNTLTYICRMTPTGDVAIFRIARQVLVAVYPTGRLARVRPLLSELYPDLIPCKSVLQPSLTNFNAVLHPPGMLMNAGWIEFTQGEFLYYYEGNTPAVARIVEDVDRERLQLMGALNLPSTSFLQSFYEAGYTTRAAFEANSVYQAMRESEGNKTIKSPSSLRHRYLDEDIAFGLVPMTAIAALAGVPMPVTDALITLASRANAVDYRQTGLTLARMGFDPANTTLDDLRARAEGG